MNWRKWLKRIGVALGSLLILAGGGGALLVWCLNYFPDPLMTVPVQCRGPAAKLKPGQRFKLLSWNIQYGAGRSYHFFYDGGPDVHASRGSVERTLKAISGVLRETAPDLLLLQEVDRDSARTARIDQLARLRDLDQWHCWASTPYHRSRYVPVPLRRPLGRVDMHLATAARFKVTWARRRALPLLKEWVVRRAFNLKRAVLESAVELEGSKRPLILLNTHLSAFSYGDGTLERQVDTILERLGELDRRGHPWILAGDFNMLPPGDRPERLGEFEAAYYANKEGALARLTKRYRTAVSPEAYARDPARYFTYLRYGAKLPDRRIDYIFVSRAIQVHSARVVRQETPSSDHLPLLLEASVLPE
ncbi:MAG: endonuclease/exonuclease/phosphatase family protein [bacterium]